jgi:hypothetical protein
MTCQPRKAAPNFVVWRLLGLWLVTEHAGSCPCAVHCTCKRRGAALQYTARHVLTDRARLVPPMDRHAINKRNKADLLVLLEIACRYVIVSHLVAQARALQFVRLLGLLLPRALRGRTSHDPESRQQEAVAGEKRVRHFFYVLRILTCTRTETRDLP